MCCRPVPTGISQQRHGGRTGRPRLSTSPHGGIVSRMLGSDGRLQIVAEGFPLPRQMAALPPASDFLTSAGFGGAAALAAAIIAALAAVFAMRRASQRHRMELEQQERQHRERREDEQHAAAVTRCWQRLVWVVETAGIEPAAAEGATLGLGPELALELLRGLLRDAERLGDDTIAKAVSVYLGQFSLVLAQQGSLLSEPADVSPSATDAKPSSATDAKPDEQPATEEPQPAPPPVADELSATTRRIAAERRHRRP